MEVLKGADVSAKLKEHVKEVLGNLDGYVPTAAIVRVGERPDDLAYERNAMKKIVSFGMEAKSFAYPETISEEEFKKEFERINADETIDGILLFCPLPKHMDSKKFSMLIDPAKDLDGISPVNMAKVFAGEEDGFAPCTAEAVIDVLKENGIELEGKNVVVIGRSLVVGRPLAMLLLKENATVTVCHTRTKNLKEICLGADILAAAAGKAKMISDEYVADGAVVVDVGINVDEEGKLCGDVKWEGLEKKAAAATPVPGGVGSVTTAVLCKHLAEAAARKRR